MAPCVRNVLREGFFTCFSHVEENLCGVSFLSACLTSWENDCLNGSSGSFLQHFLLLGMLRVGVFQPNRKYFDLSLFLRVIRSRARSSPSCRLSKIPRKSVWERQKPADCWKEIFLQTLFHTQSHSSFPRSGRCVGTFLSSQFCFLLCMKQ